MFAILLCLNHAALLSTALPQETRNAPPGLLFVKGGKTIVGSRLEHVEAWIASNPEVAGTLIGETPQHTAVAEDFLLMPTEVTNEQYAAYVTATGVPPPYSWAGAELEEGRKAFLEAEGLRAQESLAKGVPYTVKTWDPAVWWNSSWRVTPWAVPESDLAAPVVFVSCSEAEAYARWAGLRLMTELEHTRAAREQSDRLWPWGDQWNPDACNSIQRKEGGRAFPVASFPAGAVYGVHDLAGNVWEWTASSYAPFPGYLPAKVEVGRRTIDAFAEWDEDARVLVGGSYAQTDVGCRIAVRQRGTRDQRTLALGFRCAASVTAGRDAATSAIEHDIAPSVMRSRTRFDPKHAIALQRWTSEPGSTKVEGYAVITAYDHALFCPVEEIPISTEPELVRLAQAESPLWIGFVSVSQPLAEPRLAPGTYLVAWSADGEGSYLFCDAGGRPLAALHAGSPDLVRESGRTSVTFEPASAGAKTHDLHTLRFRHLVPCRNGSKWLQVELELLIQPGTLDSSWR